MGYNSVLLPPLLRASRSLSRSTTWRSHGCGTLFHLSMHPLYGCTLLSLCLHRHSAFICQEDSIVEVLRRHFMSTKMRSSLSRTTPRTAPAWRRRGVGPHVSAISSPTPAPPPTTNSVSSCFFPVARSRPPKDFC
jgi:hypothetical protein